MVARHWGSIEGRPNAGPQTCNSRTMINNITGEKEEGIQKSRSQDDEKKLTIKEKKRSFTARSLVLLTLMLRLALSSASVVLSGELGLDHFFFRLWNNAAALVTCENDLDLPLTGTTHGSLLLR